MALDLTPKLVDRYLFKQLLDYFLLGLVVFTLIAFFSDTLLSFIREIAQIGLPVDTLLTLIGLQLPKSVALVLPAASFVATLMVFNHLNNQFELISLRCGGISLWRLMAPAVVLGLLCGVVGYVLTDYVVPEANRQTEELKKDAIQKAVLPPGSNSFLFKDYDDQHNLRGMVYVSHYEGNRLADSTVIDLSKGDAMKVMQARSGVWDRRKGWTFYLPNSYILGQDRSHSVFSHAESLTFEDIFNRDEYIERQLEDQEKAERGTKVDNEKQSFAQMWQAMQTRRREGLEIKRSNYLNLWLKVTMPLSSLVIILSAVPLAMTSPRAGNNRGFVYAIPVLFLYYMLHSVFTAMAKITFPPGEALLGTPGYLTLMAWMPILLMGLIGVALIQRKTHVL